MWNNGNDCGCLWIILIIILLCCCGNTGVGGVSTGPCNCNCNNTGVVGVITGKICTCCHLCCGCICTGNNNSDCCC